MRKEPFTLAELADFTASKLIGNPHHLIDDGADLDQAQQNQAAYLANPSHAPLTFSSHAGVIFVPPQAPLSGKHNFLVNENPVLAFQKTMAALRPDPATLTAFCDIHPTALIHPTAQLGKDFIIGPYAVIDRGCSIGDRTSIGPGCYIGAEVHIGTDCLIHAHVTIREQSLIGNRVILQPGVVIGSCGFGYATDKEGTHHKLTHFGIVEIEDDVEIGANATIDRARLNRTIIGRGTKLDNQVFIAHNVKIGQGNLIAGQSGIAGSTETGNYVMMGGHVAVNGHIRIGDQVMIAGKSGVSKSLLTPGKYNGIPAIPVEKYNRMSVYLRSLEKLAVRLKNLEENLEACYQKFFP